MPHNSVSLGNVLQALFLGEPMPSAPWKQTLRNPKKKQTNRSPLRSLRSHHSHGKQPVTPCTSTASNSQQLTPSSPHKQATDLCLTASVDGESSGKDNDNAERQKLGDMTPRRLHFGNQENDENTNTQNAKQRSPSRKRVQPSRRTAAPVGNALISKAQSPLPADLLKQTSARQEIFLWTTPVPTRIAFGLHKEEPPLRFRSSSEPMKRSEREKDNNNAQQSTQHSTTVEQQPKLRGRASTDPTSRSISKNVIGDPALYRRRRPQLGF